MKDHARFLALATALLVAANAVSCARPGSGESSRSPAAAPATETPPAPLEGEDTQGGLEISISTDRQIYSQGDEVVLVVTIENTGHESVTLVHPDYWGVSEIRVTGADEADVEPSSFKAERKALENLMTIPAGESRSHAFEKLTSWTCCFGYSFHGMLEPGTYQIAVSVTNPPIEVDPPEGWSGGWVGTLISDPVTIEVE